MSSRPRGCATTRWPARRSPTSTASGALLTVAGYAVAEIAPRCSFEEACFLLFHRRLPNAAELEQFACRLAQERELPAGLWAVARQAAADRIAPMDALMILAALLRRPGPAPQPAQIVTKLMMVAGWYARLLAGAEPEPPPQQASHVEAYLHLVAGRPPDPAAVRALETYLVTVMDHGLNASTFAARVAASTHSDLLSCTLAALATLKGPRHGGAPGPALEMVERIPDVAQAADYLRAMLDRGERLMGFGHGVYRVRDPRADVLAVALEELIAAPGRRPRSGSGALPQGARRRAGSAARSRRAPATGPPADQRRVLHRPPAARHRPRARAVHADLRRGTGGRLAGRTPASNATRTSCCGRARGTAARTDAAGSPAQTGDSISNKLRNSPQAAGSPHDS